MSHCQLAGDLLWAPLQLQQRTGVVFHSGCKRVGVAARFRAFAGKLTGFFGSVGSTPGIASQIATERELVQAIGQFA